LIAATSAWIAANAALARQPNYLIKIEGYSRAFSLLDSLGDVPGLKPSGLAIQFANLANIGGIGAPGTVVLPNATPAGNILLAFMNNCRWWTYARDLR
jgi:hypothetical protein